MIRRDIQRIVEAVAQSGANVKVVRKATDRLRERRTLGKRTACQRWINEQSSRGSRRIENETSVFERVSGQSLAMTIRNWTECGKKEAKLAKMSISLLTKRLMSALNSSATTDQH